MVIIGGGQVGCETALHLTGLGKRVTVLEMRSELAPDASVTHRGDLMAEIAKAAHFIPLTDAKCTGITPYGVTYEKHGEACVLSVEAVILAAGMVPRTQEADDLAGISQAYRPVGDCVMPRTVEAATREGYFAGITI